MSIFLKIGSYISQGLALLGITLSETLSTWIGVSLTIAGVIATVILTIIQAIKNGRLKTFLEENTTLLTEIKDLVVKANSLVKDDGSPYSGEEKKNYVLEEIKKVIGNKFNTLKAYINLLIEDYVALINLEKKK